MNKKRDARRGDFQFNAGRRGPRRPGLVSRRTNRRHIFVNNRTRQRIEYRFYGCYFNYRPDGRERFCVF